MLIKVDQVLNRCSFFEKLSNNSLAPFKLNCTDSHWISISWGFRLDLDRGYLGLSHWFKHGLKHFWIVFKFIHQCDFFRCHLRLVLFLGAAQHDSLPFKFRFIIFFLVHDCTDWSFLVLIFIFPCFHRFFKCSF